MEWWQAILLGLVQGLTEFLPVSSSGHLMIFKELLGVDGEGFLDFTVTVHLATVLSTILVFWAAIRQLLKGLLQFRYNDETDYIAKICVSMIPVFVVGMFFKDQVESLFGENLTTVAVCLLVTAALLFFSDHFGRWFQVCPRDRRNGISFLQAFVVGLGQACAVAPGLSRSGTTIAVGLISGVHCGGPDQRGEAGCHGPVLVPDGAGAHSGRAGAGYPESPVWRCRPGRWREPDGPGIGFPGGLRFRFVCL